MQKKILETWKKNKHGNKTHRKKTTKNKGKDLYISQKKKYRLKHKNNPKKKR